MTSIQKKNALKKKIFLTAILIVVFGCMTAIAFGETYMALMFCRIGIYTIAVSGLDILFGYTGQISFGHAAFFAVGSYTSAYFSINMGWNPIFTMLIGVVFSMIVGAVIAILRRNWSSTFCHYSPLLLVSSYIHSRTLHGRLPVVRLD